MSQVIVDRDKIIKLINESDEIRSKLLQLPDDENEEITEVTEIAGVSDIAGATEISETSEVSSVTEASEATEVTEVTEISPCMGFLSCLSETGADIVRFMVENNFKSEEQALVSAFPSVFLRV
jgi:hypothetical protein